MAYGHAGRGRHGGTAGGAAIGAIRISLASAAELALACAAAAALAVHAALLAPHGERAPVAAAGATACVLLLASTPAGWERAAGWSTLLLAAAYAGALSLSGRGDAWAPAVAAALVLVWDAGPAAVELRRPAAMSRGLAIALARRAAGLAAAALGIGWLALLPGRVGSAGGITLTAAGAVAAVAALAVAAVLARR